MPQHNMHFLVERIYKIGSALMHTVGGNDLKLPTTIITAMKVDEKGNLYAIVQQRETRFHDKERNFPAELKFYRKGKPFYLDVKGNAQLIDDIELLNELMDWKGKDSLINRDNAMIVKIRMENITYHEWKQPSYSGINGLVKQFYQWITGINPFTYSFNMRQTADAEPQYAH